MKVHYFEQNEADKDDIHLEMSIAQGYVPKTCLLGGLTVFGEIGEGKDPCAGCAGPRGKCHGRPEAPSGKTR